MKVSIPQAVWIACNNPCADVLPIYIPFQYRKRYGLHAIYPTVRKDDSPLWFQYRKRYGLHAMAGEEVVGWALESFNTASGMDCMQFLCVRNDAGWASVSLPQAVWIACNVGAEGNLSWETIVSIPQAVWIACNK